jgi:hypothetical protein
VLYVARDDWPEASFLEQWLEENGLARKVARERMERGEFFDELFDILAAAPRRATPSSGVEAIADWLEKRLQGKAV